jgi:hypothetical protein
VTGNPSRQPFALRTVRMLALIVTAVSCSFQSCARRATVPEVAGTWSGPMMLELAHGEPAFVNVDLVLQQDRERLHGRWHTTNSIEYQAAGDAAGKISNVSGRNQVDVSFTFVGHHPGMPASGGVRCSGTASASGQLTYSTIVDANSLSPVQSREAQGWRIRLKAYDGIGFDSCPKIRYATWTFTHRD